MTPYLAFEINVNTTLSLLMREQEVFLTRIAFTQLLIFPSSRPLEIFQPLRICRRGQAVDELVEVAVHYRIKPVER